jgi:NADPH:quinone reductase-like Zn-dependent oxidoreductase
MKAIVHHRYGPPVEALRLEDVETPVPADGEALVQVRACSVNALDWYGVTGTPYIARMGGGLRAPKQPRIGVDLAGEVEAVGANVTRFKPGDEVFGARPGAFAEYVTVREDQVSPKPATVTFEAAAAVPVAALTALQALRDKGRIADGQQVLINGASGGVGTFAVQIAKSYGAEVTGVCSPRNVDLVRSLGADHVIDYTREDFVHSGRQYHLIIDVAGGRSISDRRRALRPGGTLVLVGGPKKNRMFGPLGGFLTVAVAGRFGRQTMVPMLSKSTREDLDTLGDLLAAGAIKPVVERTYPLDQVAEALRHLGEGHAQGKLVITV